MSRSGKKTRDLPNLTECHCCHLRVDLARSKNKLQLLYSEWRIVLLCHKCLARVESTATGTPTTAAGSSSGEEISICGDCWVSESLVRWTRGRISGAFVRSKAAVQWELGFERSRVWEAACCSVRVDDVVEEENVDVDGDEPFKEGQGSCSNDGVELEACSWPPEDCNCITGSWFETCNGSSLDPYYFKYRRRKRSGDQCWLTYKRRRINIVGSCKSLSDVEELPLLTYKRRGRRFMVTYKRRMIFGQSMLTYKRRKPGTLHSRIQLEGQC